MTAQIDTTNLAINTACIESFSSGLTHTLKLDWSVMSGSASGFGFFVAVTGVTKVVNDG